MKDGSFTLDIAKLITEDKGFEIIQSITGIPDKKHAISLFEEIQMQIFNKVVTKKEQYEDDYKEEYEDEKIINKEK
jgi:hypothetical protein